MTDLPGFPIDPLQPPAGAYDGVAARARSRRTRSALVAGGLALALGTAGVGTAALLGSSSTPEDDSLGVATAPPTVSASPTSEPTGRPTASPTPASVAPTFLVTQEPLATDQPTDDIPVITGKVVDAAGKPLAGIYVYSLTQSSLDNASDTRTRADGSFEITCSPNGLGAAKVLLSSFELGIGRRAQPGPNHAFTWVGGGGDYSSAPALACKGARDTATTSMARGATLTGRLLRAEEDGSHAPFADHVRIGFGLYCERVLGIQSTQCAEWDPVGGRYSFPGLAGGTYQLTGMYGSDLVEVPAGTVVQRDWYEGDCCPKGRAPSASPSASPTPTATASAAPGPSASPAS